MLFDVEFSDCQNISYVRDGDSRSFLLQSAYVFTGGKYPLLCRFIVDREYPSGKAKIDIPLVVGPRGQLQLDVRNFRVV